MVHSWKSQLVPPKTQFAVRDGTQYQGGVNNYSYFCSFLFLPGPVPGRLVALRRRQAIEHRARRGWNGDSVPQGRVVRHRRARHICPVRRSRVADLLRNKIDGAHNPGRDKIATGMGDRQRRRRRGLQGENAALPWGWAPRAVAGRGNQFAAVGRDGDPAPIRAHPAADWSGCSARPEYSRHLTLPRSAPDIEPQIAQRRIPICAICGSTIRVGVLSCGFAALRSLWLNESAPWQATRGVADNLSRDFGQAQGLGGLNHAGSLLLSPLVVNMQKSASEAALRSRVCSGSAETAHKFQSAA